ncbi:hypothetical protein C1H46_037664 [Malus baccata]|uniref:Uncharacterized protein n=1 Tax=Malus baccata TaxID=106549 RepID=A0A540KS15_MALBA|nr:hypothetical protein C1H46_037664 [Malus baccata]
MAAAKWRYSDSRQPPPLAMNLAKVNAGFGDSRSERGQKPAARVASSYISYQHICRTLYVQIASKKRLKKTKSSKRTKKLRHQILRHLFRCRLLQYKAQPSQTISIYFHHKATS